MSYHLSALCVLTETSVDDFLLISIATRAVTMTVVVVTSRSFDEDQDSILYLIVFCWIQADSETSYPVDYL